MGRVPERVGRVPGRVVRVLKKKKGGRVPKKKNQKGWHVPERVVRVPKKQKKRLGLVPERAVRTSLKNKQKKVGARP